MLEKFDIHFENGEFPERKQRHNKREWRAAAFL